MHQTSCESDNLARPPALGGISYYPAFHRGTFGNIRAALASIGCVGAPADLMIDNAKAEGSPVIAAPVKVKGAPAEVGECVGLVRRKPGGRADLFVGLLYLACDNEAEAHALAQQLADGACGEVFVFEWCRQRRAIQ